MDSANINGVGEGVFETTRGSDDTAAKYRTATSGGIGPGEPDVFIGGSRRFFALLGRSAKGGCRFI